MIVTTTPTLAGNLAYQPLGVVTGVDSYTIGGLFGEGLFKADKFFNDAYQRAELKLIAKAAELNADAVVGVQFTALSMDTTSKQMFITLLGTAIKLMNDAADELPEL